MVWIWIGSPRRFGGETPAKIPQPKGPEPMDMMKELMAKQMAA